jgi:CheY-like chemotaxis protein
VRKITLIFGGIAFASCSDQVAMKSCQCAQCNVSSARFAWGFALLARDGWELRSTSPLFGSPDGVWFCPACHARSEVIPRGLARPEAPKRAGTVRSRPGSRLRILLVDDEEMVRRCTVRLLSEFEIVTAGSALEALGILRQDSDFHAVLSDVMMPGMSGPELYAVCYRNFPSIAQRFVFASGNPEAARAQLQRAVASVAAEQAPILLSKPTSHEALVLALFAAAAQGEPRSGTYSVVEPVDIGVSKYRG